MTETRLNNSIFIMFLATESYKKQHALSNEKFISLDDKYHILNYISECPDIFDNMSEAEMVKEIDSYVTT